jgi:hypothetical protein
MAAPEILLPGNLFLWDQVENLPYFKPSSHPHDEFNGQPF